MSQQEMAQAFERLTTIGAAMPVAQDGPALYAASSELTSLPGTTAGLSSAVSARTRIVLSMGVLA